MNENSMPEIDSSIPSQHAVSVYPQDALDEFPVLKAFQQYIDAEQAKARKRLLALGIFFGVLTGAIIAVFIVMLANMSSRNQQLNDRLVEYAMKDRERQSAVVVQPPQDSTAIMTLTTKINELQRKLDESRAKAEKDAAIAAERARQEAAEAAKPKGPTPEELEIKRLKDLLAAEREKAAEQARIDARRIEKERAAAEKERKRQEELEAYRRKYYPELYEQPKTPPKQHRLTPKSAAKVRAPAAIDDEEDDDLLPDDDDAIDYFSESAAPARSATKPAAKPAAKKTAATAAPAQKRKPAKVYDDPAPAEEEPYVIPVEVKGKSSSFRIPI